MRSKPTIGPGVTDLLDEQSPFAGNAVPPPAVNPCTEADRTAAVAVWDKLRKVDYPFHLQAIALSPPFQSGCRALIVTEPPPAIKLETVQGVAPGLLTMTETRRHDVGYDGWTQDIVMTLPPITDPELKELVAGLHSVLFETTYQMETLDTSILPPKYDPTSAPLDVGIGPGDLNRWLLTENTAFAPVQGGAARPFRDLLHDEEAEVYLDEANGLVAWIVPRGSDIARMGRAFRQFTLDSDLIIGAVASDKAVAIIARQRVVDPRILQPLRFETVSLLAAVNKDSLQQSYDRTNALAGRIDATRDWAPIFLSPELRDTEYGSILDIADQFLKSWSNNGKTQYINFKYPTPRRWAFSAPVFIVAKADSFRYNWNTTNIGAVVNIAGLDLFWLRRTGALNVSYFPDEHEDDAPAPASQAVQGLEETAYQWFVKTQVPILARVVQYNALFQIFSRFKLTSSSSVAATENRTGARVLKAATLDALTNIAKMDNNEIKRRLKGYLSTAVKQVVKELRKYPQFAEFDAAQRELALSMLNIREVVTARTTEQVTDLAVALRRLDSVALDNLAENLGSPREAKGIRSDLFPVFKQVRELGHAFPLFTEPKVYERYAASISATPGTWIHTPSIVISWNEGAMQDGIGGHSLEAKVTSLTLDARNPGAAAARIAAKLPVDSVGPAELDRLVLGQHGPTLTKVAETRAARTALGVGDRPRYWHAPWRPGTGTRAPTAGDAGGDFHVAKLNGGYRVVGPTGVAREATTMPEVIEQVTARGGSRNGRSIRFEGFTEDEARGVLRAAELKTEARLAGVVRDVPEFATRRLDFSKARVFEAQIRVFPGGAGEIGLAVEVPDFAKRSIWIRIKLAFRNATPEWLRTTGAKIRSTVEEVIARFAGRPSAAKEVGVALRQELKTLLPDVDLLELKLKAEASDLTIVQREPPASCGADRHGA